MGQAKLPMKPKATAVDPSPLGPTRLKKTHRSPTGIHSYGSLSEAIISQFGLLYDDPAEWRTCDNCGRIFKKYREEKPGRVIQKTRFCKRSCANAYSKKKSQGLITEQSV